MNWLGDCSLDDIGDFLINCGNSECPRELAVRIIENMNKIMPYDQARIYFLDQKGFVTGEILLGVDRRWMNAYRDYFSLILDGKYAVPGRVKNSDVRRVKSAGIINYTVCSGDEFVSDYIRPQKILYNLSCSLYDQHGIIKKILMFDRAGKTNYSERDILIFSMILPHLQNLHKNYYAQPKSDDNFCQDDRDPDSGLTKRELEIAMMVSEGYTPERISKSLFVSRTTVYKHIAHIHEKLNVSNRQELILKLLHMNEKQQLS
jgi:DNA-binding CsgD family transcriptional regulator